MNLIKQFAPMIANSDAFERFLRLLEHADGNRENLVRVLTYHRVDEPGAHLELDPVLISASPEVFESQMKYLAANYEVISLLDLIEAFEHPSKDRLPARAVLITFDDAYLDFEAFAWPILKRYSLPVTLFVPTAFPDQPERLFWWDRLFNIVQRACDGINTPIGRLPVSTSFQRDQALIKLKSYFKRLPHKVVITEVNRMYNELGLPPQSNVVLGWSSLRRLASEGVTLGAHTRNHPIMNHLSPDDLQNEIVGSKQDVMRETGIEPVAFAYPSGIHNNYVVQAVKDAGFRLAFTTERGLNDLKHVDRLRLRRINIGSRTTLPVMRAQLLSWSAPLISMSNRLYS